MPEASRITTPFDASSTASDVVSGIDLTNRRVIVTGGASGIGVETARALASAGAQVTLAVRDLDAGERVADDIIATTGNQLVAVAPLNLVDQASVATFVASWHGPVHILINNAGVMATPELRTPEGWELQFATNHLGHFALANGLHDALAAAGGARVVSVSSTGHLRSPVVFEDINFLRRPYDPLLAYGQSKTANVLFAVEASTRWADDGITVNALMPGATRTPGVASVISGTPADQVEQWEATRTSGSGPVWKTPQQGAATSVVLATSPRLDGVGGRYFENCNEAGPHVPGTQTGVAAYALDPEAAAHLWRVSIDMLS